MFFFFKYFLPLLVAAGLMVFLIPALIPMARKVGLVDRPGRRKQHIGEIPLVGGIAIALSLALAILLFPESFSNFRILFFCIGLLMISGVLDDQREITAAKKLASQFTAALILTILGNSVVTSLGDILNIDRTIGLSVLAIPFSSISIVGAINSFNMIDGHDGLAAVIATLSLSGLGFLLLIRGSVADLQYGILILLLLILLVVFLLYNLSLLVSPKYKIFLGDAGSNFLGFVVAFFLIEFSQREIEIVSPSAAPWVIGLPLLDMFAVIIGRLVNRSSIIAPDRNHAHHVLKQFGLRDSYILGILALVQGCFVCIAILGTLLEWPEWLLFWGIFPLLAIYLLGLRVLRHHAERKV